MSRIDRIVIGICVIVVVFLLAMPVAIEAPMFARCTQAATDILERADPLERRPPAALAAAVEYELTNADLPLVVARMSMRNSHCNGPNHRSIERLFETLGLSVWWRMRFSHEDLVALYLSQAWLGYRPMGFAAASRAFFGREMNMLSPDEQRCLARKVRAPSVRDYTCTR